MEVTKQKLLYEGKGKRMFETSNPELIIAEFKDDLTAFNALKKSKEAGKGALNCKISTELFMLLKNNGINSHFIKKLDDIEMLCHKVKIIPLEVVVRNITTGSICKRLGIKEGIYFKDTPLKVPLVEFYYKDDDLGDPLLYEKHAIMLGIATQDELDEMAQKALKVNEILSSFFDRANLTLVDFKLEFGLDNEGNIILADEISPDSARLWDKLSGEKMDKDRFRQDLGGLKVAYEEVLNRLLKL
ncbi:phosphoribosylaminoimidazolesuccinocarboxamide synthase [Helicobacter sp. 13S00401-1]|uniref:phosphoribosylaminoimidazolesuccinocarboxamide synthase n=1 Tax=Helicobacter sp. 13S00401-1 TaxID=1905758 RepID=UPI000BA58E96|nr:phosphoribosylaminoimidazolesuccinocarboxamide synthase [Helicobacter sp. 13S00401-1]PAF51857.1 phosphoribosylaminoimidazolesuccinocarboxamide synthase [Helicobacter sp. 13S00401-1]